MLFTLFNKLRCVSTETPINLSPSPYCPLPVLKKDDKIAFFSGIAFRKSSSLISDAVIILIKNY